MPKKLRLSQAEFALLRKQQSRRIYGSYFVLSVYTLPSSFKGPRAASIISKKTVPSAVSRNRVERRLREIVRENKTRLDSLHAYIFSARKSVTKASYSELKSDIQTLLG